MTPPTILCCSPSFGLNPISIGPRNRTVQDFRLPLEQNIIKWTNFGVIPVGGRAVHCAGIVTFWACIAFLEPKMTSDGFMTFWRSVRNIFIFKTSYLGPDLEEI
ncbi:unnamed protein product [Prunus armeniaca]